MNMFYENNMFIKHEFYYFFYLYICMFSKRYRDFKGSQIAMNEFLKFKKLTFGASIYKRHDPANGYKVTI